MLTCLAPSAGHAPQRGWYAMPGMRHACALMWHVCLRHTCPLMAKEAGFCVKHVHGVLRLLRHSGPVEAHASCALAVAHLPSLHRPYSALKAPEPAADQAQRACCQALTAGGCHKLGAASSGGNATLKARRVAHACMLRPYSALKALQCTQGPTVHSRPYSALKARRMAHACICSGLCGLLGRAACASARQI